MIVFLVSFEINFVHKCYPAQVIFCFIQGTACGDFFSSFLFFVMKLTHSLFSVNASMPSSEMLTSVQSLVLFLSLS